jgi:hypothetical protein
MRCQLYGEFGKGKYLYVGVAGKVAWVLQVCMLFGIGVVEVW